MTEEEAFLAATDTFHRRGEVPVVHYSETDWNKRIHSHAKYVKGPINLFGRRADVMVEAGGGLTALLALRGDIPFPGGPGYT